MALIHQRRQKGRSLQAPSREGSEHILTTLSIGFGASEYTGFMSNHPVGHDLCAVEHRGDADHVCAFRSLLAESRNACVFDPIQTTTCGSVIQTEGLIAPERGQRMVHSALIVIAAKVKDAGARSNDLESVIRSHTGSTSRYIRDINGYTGAHFMDYPPERPSPIPCTARRNVS
jgi:hypothetical protein